MAPPAAAQCSWGWPLPLIPRESAPIHIGSVACRTAGVPPASFRRGQQTTQTTQTRAKRTRRINPKRALNTKILVCLVSLMVSNSSVHCVSKNRLRCLRTQKLRAGRPRSGRSPAQLAALRASYAPTAAFISKPSRVPPHTDGEAERDHVCHVVSSRRDRVDAQGRCDRPRRLSRERRERRMAHRLPGCPLRALSHSGRSALDGSEAGPGVCGPGETRVCSA
jgi:hypothetical protein